MTGQSHHMCIPDHLCQTTPCSDIAFTPPPPHTHPSQAPRNNWLMKDIWAFVLVLAGSWIPERTHTPDQNPQQIPQTLSKGKIHFSFLSLPDTLYLHFPYTFSKLLLLPACSHLIASLHIARTLLACPVGTSPGLLTSGSSSSYI